MQITRDIKDIYNAYLKTMRTSQNKPWRPRKNFDKFTDENYVYCNRLLQFFNSQPQINYEDFFNAPYTVYEDFIPDLKFYTTRKAITCYVNYIAKLQNLPPDNEYHLNHAKQSLKYIRDYCVDNDIPWDDYLNSEEYIPHWLKHLKRRDTSIYVLMTYNNFKQLMDCLESDIIILYMQQIYDNYLTYKNMYLKSKVMKPFLQAAIPKCKAAINEQNAHNKK